MSALTLALILGYLSGTSTAQTAPQALPKAEQILDRYIEAIGGLAAMEKINNRVTKGTMDIPTAGVKLSITVYQARPNKYYSVMDSAATGKVETGSDGEVVWQISTTSGPQIFEGKEKASQLHLNVFDRLAYWRKIFKQVETTGTEDVAGKSCYKVLATPPDLAPQTLFFDKESGLLVKLVDDRGKPDGRHPGGVFSQRLPADRRHSVAAQECGQDRRPGKDRND